LIADLGPDAQPLPADERREGVEIIAMMLVHLVQAAVNNEAKEVRDESR
jgi:hypothetical protein